MSFAFGFSADALNADEPATAATATIPAPLNPQELIPPAEVALEPLLESLTNVRMTFDQHTTPAGNTLFRRLLFDIKHQAMVEDDGLANTVHTILLGAGDEVDLQKNVYEGGFKLWECSYDLVDALATQWAAGLLRSRHCLLELGCGTALPSCFLMAQVFASTDACALRTVVLTDFNKEVVRLVTLPNLIAAWVLTLDPAELPSLMDSGIPLNADEILLTLALLARFRAALAAKSINLRLLHGSWGASFCKLVAPHKPDLILTSETIYSPETLPVVLDTLLLLTSGDYLVLVAAKKYYFGVGGSIVEFMQRLHAKKPPTMHVDTLGGGQGQLKRDIVRMRPSASATI